MRKSISFLCSSSESILISRSLYSIGNSLHKDLTKAWSKRGSIESAISKDFLCSSILLLNQWFYSFIFLTFVFSAKDIKGFNNIFRKHFRKRRTCLEVQVTLSNGVTKTAGQTFIFKATSTQHQQSGTLHLSRSLMVQSPIYLQLSHEIQRIDGSLVNQFLHHRH